MDTVDKEIDELKTLKIFDQIEDFVKNDVPFDKSAIFKGVPGNRANHDKFMNMYDNYIEPRLNSASYLTYYRACNKEKQIINQQRRVNARRRGIELDELDLFVDDLREKDKIIEEQGQYLGLCPYTGRHNIPLVNKREVSFEHYNKFVKRYGKSKEVALPATVEALVIESERRGLSKRQLSELMVYFCNKYLTELNAVVAEKYSQKRWRDLYESIIKRMDIKEEKGKCFKAIRQVTRYPGDNIVTVTSQLDCLCRQSMEVTQPYTSEEERRKGAEDFILKYIRVFINQECNKKYEQFLEKAIGVYTASLDRCVAELQNIESKGNRFRITEPRRLPNNLSLTEIMSKGDPTPEITTEVNNMNIKENGRKSRRDKKPHDRRRFRSGRSQSSYKSSESRASSKGYSTTRTRSPSVNQIQESKTQYPGKEKKQWENNNGGRKEGYQNVDKSRYKESKSGQYQNGNRSRSQSLTSVNRLRSKSPRETGACVRCGYQGHRGESCFRFSSATTKYCPICLERGFKLFHDPFLCNRTSRSSYRSPTPNTREQRIKYLEEKNAKTAQNH